MINRVMAGKKILLYGFRPYKNYTENITEKIIASLSKPDGPATCIFDVQFDKEMFRRVLKSYQPDYIIGLGQHPRAKKLRIERKAKNLWREPGKEARVISKKLPEEYIASLSFPETELTTKTYNAGDYVCNFSMFVMLEYCSNNGAEFGFLHVPKTASVKEIAGYLKKFIRTL